MTQPLYGVPGFAAPRTQHTARLAKQREVKQFLQFGCQGLCFGAIVERLRLANVPNGIAVCCAGVVLHTFTVDSMKYTSAWGSLIV